MGKMKNNLATEVNESNSTRIRNLLINDFSRVVLKQFPDVRYRSCAGNVNTHRENVSRAKDEYFMHGDRTEHSGRMSESFSLTTV